MDNINWLGDIVFAKDLDDKGAFDLFRNFKFEIGLKDDGTVVWRKKKDNIIQLKDNIKGVK